MAAVLNERSASGQGPGSDCLGLWVCKELLRSWRLVTGAVGLAYMICSDMLLIA